MKNYYYLFIIIFLLSCNGNQNEITKISEFTNRDCEIITFSNETISTIKASEFFDRVHTIKLQTIDDALIGRISKVQIHKKRIYILDKIQNCLFCFLIDGSYYKKYENIGKGPNEYLRLTDFDINPFNESIILLADNKKLQVLDLELNFISSLNVGHNIVANNISVISEEILAFYTYSGSFNTKTNEVESSLLMFHNTKTNSQTRYFDSETSSRIGLINENAIFKSEDILFTTPLNYTLYGLERNGAYAKFELNFGDMAIENAIIDGFKNRDDWTKFRSNISLIKNKVIHIENPIVLGNVLYFLCVIGTERYYAFSNLETKTSFLVKEIENDISEYAPFGRPLGSNSNFIITYLEPSRILSKFPSSKISPTINEFDNPVLNLFYVK